jgi:fused signal recognition particle receptor
MFGFIKDKIKKVYDSFTTKVAALFLGSSLDETFIKELTNLLIVADTGTKTTQKIIDNLTSQIAHQKVTTLLEAKQALEDYLYRLLNVDQAQIELTPAVLLMVGINGSGKTTFVAKLANKLKQQGKRVLVVAGDTFRAAATHQLIEWGQRIGVEVFVGKENQDPSSVIFDACQKFRDDAFDHIIIDTAGRLQTKVNLMKELEKIHRIIAKQLPQEIIHTWLTIDTMLGQNSLAQAQIFFEATQLSGLVLTKFDGTGKGGVVFAITDQLRLPILYVTFGENIDDFKPFDARSYASELLNE